MCRRLFHIAAILAILLITTAPSLRAAETVWTPQTAKPNPAVEYVDLELVDAVRQRTVPVRIWYPVGSGAPFPVVVFSHGLGGTRDGYGYFGKFLAANGYVSIHPQHVGSDDSVWRGKARPLSEMRAAAGDAGEALARPADVTFVLNEATRLNGEKGVLTGRMNLNQIAVAGHSFGAYTALTVAGRQLVPRGASSGLNLRDPRVRACIVMSAPGNVREMANGSYAKFSVPCLHMTGTADSSLVNGSGPESRRIPFDSTSAPNQFLLTFQGGDHLVFSGRRDEGRGGKAPGRLGAAIRDLVAPGMGGDKTKDPVFQDLILQSSFAFLEAYLRGDEGAKRWLSEGGFTKALGANGTFEGK